VPDSRHPRALRYVVLYGAGWPLYALNPLADRIRRPWWASALTTPRRYRPGLFPVPTESIVHKRADAVWPDTIKMWPSLIAWGRWDQVPTMARSWETPHIHAVLEGQDYRSLPVYETLREEQARTGTTYLKNLKSPDQIDAYFQQIPKLAESIRRDGIRPGREFGSKEIQVRIARDGTLLKCGEGTHRLAIARAVGIEQVPVEVELCHASWARQVMQRYSAPFPTALAQWFADPVDGPTVRRGVDTTC